MRGTTIYLPGRIQPVEFDRPQKQFNTAQKSNVEPAVATYSFNSMLYKYFITNYACQNYLQSMIVKMPITKDKQNVLLVFLTKCFILAHKVTHNLWLI